LSDRGLILIVDDDETSSRALQELLARDGYGIVPATSGTQVLEAISAHQAKLVLLDTHLEQADPFELLARIKVSPLSRDVPVIFITTLDDAEARAEGLEAGDDLIFKPFNAREVLARIERQVTVSTVRMALRESEAKFRSVMESAIDAIISANHIGEIVGWNRAATRILG